MPEPEDDPILSVLGLEEIKKSYESEDERKKSLDTKAATIIGFVTFIIAALTFSSNMLLEKNLLKPQIMIYFSSYIISLILFISSLFFLIKAISNRKYLSPYAYNPNETYNYVTQPLNKLQEEMISRYAECTHFNHFKNNHKSNSINISLILIVTGIIFILIATLFKVLVDFVFYFFNIFLQFYL